MTLSPKHIWKQEDRESAPETAQRTIHQAEAALQGLWAIYDAQLDTLPHCAAPKMFGRVLGHLSQAMMQAQTLLEAYDYFLARCLETGLSPDDAAAAWDIHGSEVFEAELVEAELVGPNALRLIDATLLARLGMAPHEAATDVAG